MRCSLALLVLLSLDVLASAQTYQASHAALLMWDNTTAELCLPLDGDFRDISIHDRTGTLTGILSPAEGKIDGAIRFVADGVNNNFRIHLDLVPTNFTVCSWINPFSVNRWNILVDNVDNNAAAKGFKFGGANDSLFRFQICTTGGTVNVYSSTIMQTNQWEHWASTYDGSYATVYRNGELVSSNAAPGYIVNDNTLWFGYRHAIFNYSLDGLADDIRFYDRALPPAEIKAIAEGTML